MDLDKTCLICSKTTSRGLSHVSRIHKLTKQEYIDLYPEYNKYLQQKEKRRIENMRRAAQVRATRPDHPFYRPELIFESRKFRAKNNSNIIKKRLTT